MKAFAAVALWVALFATAAVSPASALSVPEKLEYEVSWSGLNAGTAVQEVSAQGKELRLVYTVRSSGWLKSFFSIDDKTESIVSRGSGAEPVGLPRLYRENIHEGKTHTQKEARFDQKNLKVETKDFLKNTEKVDPITARTFDTLSCIYFIRFSDLASGKPVFIDIYDCKRLWNAEVRVVRREEIGTPAGRFKTLVVTTQLKSEGVKPRLDYLTVWLTDDSRRIPVKITSKLKVGEFTATLAGGSY
jgi:hypothetical protein